MAPHWKPIDSAPHNGTAILLLASVRGTMGREPRPIVGRWDASEAGWREDLLAGHDRIEHDLLPIAWCELPAQAA